MCGNAGISLSLSAQIINLGALKPDIGLQRSEDQGTRWLELKSFDIAKFRGVGC